MKTDYIDYSNTYNDYKYYSGKEPCFSNFTFSEIEAYLNYTNEYYYNVNNSLRSGMCEDKAIYDLIKNLDSLFQKVPARLKNQKEIDVYIGVILNEDMYNELDKALKSGVLTDKGYLSTSLNIETAKKFALQNSQYEDKGLIFHIKVPKGTTFITSRMFRDIKSKNQLENEVLFPRNSQLRILSYDRKNKIVEAEYIGQTLPLQMPEFYEREATGSMILSDIYKYKIKNDFIEYKIKNKV